MKISKPKKVVSRTTVWPKGLKFEKLDQTIAITHFADMEKFNAGLIDYMLAYEQEKLKDMPRQSASRTTKLHHIDSWAVPGAKLLDERAQAFYRWMTGAKTSHVDLSWGNIYYDGDYIMPHAHRRSTGSVVYVLTLGDISDDPMSGKFCIADPRLPICREGGGDVMTNLVMPELRVGSMIIFPSNVVHSVNPYRGVRPRITLAWNINNAPLRERTELENVGVAARPGQE